MKPINLKSVVLAHKGLPETLRDDLYKLWDINPKSNEIAAIEYLISQLEGLAPYNDELLTKILGNCYFGFVIPRISKEFDCLWLGDNTVLNIELKSRNVGEDRIKRQLEKNRYYLKFLKRIILTYTLVVSSGTCYYLDENDNLITIAVKDMASALSNIHKERLIDDDIETYFPPEQFLVSPFNSTEEFLKDYYFLTSQQQDIKEKIIAFVNDPSCGKFCALTGGPGSGKTLLLYDIAKSLMQAGKRVLIGQAGVLNNGHNILMSNGWQIKATKSFFIYNQLGKSEFAEADIYMIDESQRCYNIDKIVEEISKTNRKCVFAFDADQVMSNSEEKRGNGNLIKTLVGDRIYGLTSNVRTNAVVYDFVKALFDKNHSVTKGKKGHVEITYCRTSEEAMLMLRYLQKIGYHVPMFTPKKYGREDYENIFPNGVLSAHEVIGQEFNDVAGLISENMYYAGDGKLLSRKGYYYREDKMLYQILSRARRKIHLVIVNNPSMLERCLKLIG